MIAVPGSIYKYEKRFYLALGYYVTHWYGDACYFSSAETNDKIELVQNGEIVSLHPNKNWEYVGTISNKELQFALNLLKENNPVYHENINKNNQSKTYSEIIYFNGLPLDFINNFDSNQKNSDDFPRQKR